MKIQEYADTHNLPVSEDGFVFLDCRTAPISVTGLPWMKENNNFHRLPDRLADRYSDGVAVLHRNTAGASLRFRTDSGQLAFRVEAADVDEDTNMSRDGKMGLDVYYGSGSEMRSAGIVRVPEKGLSYSGMVWLPGGMRDITVYLPLYASIERLEVGFRPDSVVEESAPFAVSLPVCFYGSSITQGGSASRAGNCYQAMLSRTLGFEVVNFGFSGNAKGEPLMAELIGSVPQAALVLAYDHNAPTPGFLADTHEEFFRTYRRYQPETPVIFLSRANLDGGGHWKRFREVIETTYVHAVEAGDRNVRFLDGSRIYGETFRDACTVDGCHPSDLGFFRIYEALLPILKEVLSLR